MIGQSFNEMKKSKESSGLVYAKAEIRRDNDDMVNLITTNNVDTKIPQATNTVVKTTPSEKNDLKRASNDSNELNVKSRNKDESMSTNGANGYYEVNAASQLGDDSLGNKDGNKKRRLARNFKDTNNHAEVHAIDDSSVLGSDWCQDEQLKPSGHAKQPLDDDGKFIPLEIQNNGEGTYSALSSAASSPNRSQQDSSSDNNQLIPKHQYPCSESVASITSFPSSTSSPYPVPPAPPSTPVTNYQYSESGLIECTDNNDIPTSSTSAKRHLHDVSTPLPNQNQTTYSHNGDQSATTSTTSNNKPSSSSSSNVDEEDKIGKNNESDEDMDMVEDFSKWKVGSRYELIRILGRGSYGEVAQARDKYSERLARNGEEKFVAIKKITTAFEHEVDSLRLFREIHILRKLRGHDDCIIQLLDVIAPESDSIDDLEDLYLVFECKSAITAQLRVVFHLFIFTLAPSLVVFVVACIFRC